MKTKQYRIIRYFIFILLVSGISGTWLNGADSIKIWESKGDLLIPGEVVSFHTKGEHHVRYHVYTPLSFNPENPPPMVIGFSSEYDGKALLLAFSEAAEAMGWIGVGCDTLGNNMKTLFGVERAQEVEMEDELLDDILNTIPHNPQRVYFTGGSGGAMRAYGLTVRRSDTIAGVIAHCGWLGGPRYQDKAYPEGMTVAMLNGNMDMGSGAWTNSDTKTLQNRNCTVKHFTYLGGHIFGPASSSLTAMKWIEEQYNKEPLADESIIPLKILYVGNSEERTSLYKSFLQPYFVSVSTTSTDSLTLAKANVADILVLDDAVYTLPDNYNKAMVLIGPSAVSTSQRWGSKMKSAGMGINSFAINIDTAHTIFKTPHPVSLGNLGKGFSGTALLARSANFSGFEDSEIISDGRLKDGTQGALILREASRLFWGSTTPPDKMTEESQKVFVNSLAWIHEFEGIRQTEYMGMTPRDSISHIIENIDLSSKDALRWFPPDVLDSCDYDKQKLRDYFTEGKPYVFTNYGSGQYRIDEEARKLGTPNNDPSSLIKWNDIIHSSKWPVRWTVGMVFSRYAIKGLPRDEKLLKEWYDLNYKNLEFRDDLGYQFHLMSPNYDFLNGVWERTKRVMGYHIFKDGADVGLEPNGVLEGKQTFWDPMWYGPNPYNNTLYLAALRAAEEMAIIKGESDLAKRYHAIFEKGQQYMNERMWNGEYYVHLYPAGFSGTGMTNGFAKLEEVEQNAAGYVDAFNKGDANYFVSTGCDANQLFGQNWANQLGLGYILPSENCYSAAKSIFLYNWTPDISTVYDSWKPKNRTLAVTGEGAMINGSWPREKPQEFENTHDKNDIWSGLEYEASCDMINEGLLEEAFIAIRSIHDRYDGVKRNPWNEIEGSDHYSRAMHSWNIILSLSGYTYDGPGGKMGFAPRLSPENFKCFFSSAEGWGNISQLRTDGSQEESIEVKWGQLRLKELKFALEKNQETVSVKVSTKGKPVSFDHKVVNGEILIIFDSDHLLRAGEQMLVHINKIP